MSDNVSALPSWALLAKLAQEVGTISSCLEDSARNERLQIAACGVDVDFSKQRMDSAVVDALLDLAGEAELTSRREALLNGAHVNTSEDRPAMHTALRTPRGEGLDPFEAVVQSTLDAVCDLATSLSDGSWRGYTGQTITDIVHIGIGGSHLGPELVASALPSRNRFRLHFVANIDGHAITEALKRCNPERTAFIVVSKSFSTLETLANAKAARSWFIERGGTTEDIARHFFAISAAVDSAVAFGIPLDNILPMWDWVGGRYSVWSAVGIPIALAHGPTAFRELLAGARAMDEHFASAPFDRNLPVLSALVGVWNSNFLGANNHAVLAYDERLTLLPLYLQQLETESNGKRVRLDGRPVEVQTMPILWGGVGTTGQHAYHQLLHQGTRNFSADFIFARSSDHSLDTHHRWLQANALAQSQAMMQGDDAPAEKYVPGNHPTTTIVLDRLDAFHLGALLALHEHKVFCQGVIWGINSFDQWGVELGKRLAGPIFNQLGGEPAITQDASTQHLIRRLT